MQRLSSSIRLALGLAFPGAAFALGLGDIHVESALYQPLAAQIDLMGVSDEDLARLTAAIADDEAFRRYGLDRPMFLAGTDLTVSRDSLDRPVLLLRSREKVTEPTVTFLVDLHSPDAELIREYTLLLDPPALAARANGIEVASSMPPHPAAVPASSVIVPGKAAVISPDAGRGPSSYAVAPHDTLDQIARIAGAHSTEERRRMMIAIFRTNPAAFHANFNSLRSGVTLRLPSAEEVAAISATDVNREYAAQMAAWRGTAHRRPVVASPPVSVTPPAIGIGTPDMKPAVKADETERQILAERVASLEASLEKMRRELKQARAAAPTAPATAVSMRAPVASAKHEGRAATPLRPLRFAPVGVGLGLVLAAAAAWWQRRRRKIRNAWLRAAGPAGEAAAAPWAEAAPETAVAPVDGTASVARPLPSAMFAGDSVERRFALYNPESTINTTHVIMSDAPDRRVHAIERRRNPADVLRLAIEREPTRNDLRLKLLELYYTAAAENRRAFLEAVRQLAKNKQLASVEDWSRIADMGRTIAPDDELFSAAMDDKAVA